MTGPAAVAVTATGASAPPASLHGGCLCGAVRYRIEGGLAALGPVVLCHCGQCRKAQGGAFAANVPVDATSFTLLQGSDALAEYASSADKRRSFCARCGSPIHSRRLDKPGVLRLRLGSLDDATAGLAPAAHIHVASKAAWWTLPEDGLPRHPGVEPGRA